MEMEIDIERVAIIGFFGFLLVMIATLAYCI